MLTEDQAKQKWCPFAHVVHSNADGTMHTAANAFGDGYRSNATLCIASDCMAWRIVDPKRPEIIFRDYKIIPGAFTEEAAFAAPRRADVPASWQIEDDGEGGYGWFEPEAEFEARKKKHIEEWPNNRRGYCGLAGLPGVGT